MKPYSKKSNRCRAECKWQDSLVLFGCSRIIRTDGWQRSDIQACPIRKKLQKKDKKELYDRWYRTYQENGYNRRYYRKWRRKNRKKLRIYFRNYFKNYKKKKIRQPEKH